jgi:hypothetical protein
LRALKKLIQAYRAAAFFDDGDEDIEAPRIFKYRIDNTAGEL